TGSERFQTRLVLAGHLGLGLTQIHDDVLAFLALDGGVDDFPDTADVLVVNRVPFRLAHLLKNDLLGKLRRNSPQNIRSLVSAQLTADFGSRIDALGLIERDLQVGILDLLQVLNNRSHRVGANLAALLVQLGAQVLLRLVVLSGGHNNGILNRAHDNLRIDAFLPAQSVDYVVQFTRHKMSATS